ncbi:5-formyltetrahydrofolate cyclo-ligase [Aliiglaciecola litoralis]|uniref:5-formyltetrahydrofolate cyclo-ligase n=1 Tax=Aliiglaciecola litoralis TaxID=582857 RepID=UPI0031CE45C9
MNSTEKSKQQLRSYYRQARRSLSNSEQQQAEAKLLEQLLSSGTLDNQRHIAVYLSQDGEISCQALINWCWHNKVHTYLPVLNPHKAGYLLFLPYTKETKMKNNQYQILEPVFDPQSAIDLDALSLMLMPLVAFDLAGNRLGMGGGFYDRTLSQKLAKNSPSTRPFPLLCGVAHDCQQAQRIETQSWDVPVDKIITPSTVINNAL